jgi:hypothetical protein
MNLFLDCTPSTTPNHTVINGVYTTEDAINWAIQNLYTMTHEDWLHYNTDDVVTVQHSLDGLMHTFLVNKCPIEVDMDKWVDAVGKQGEGVFAFTVHNDAIRNSLVQETTNG